MTAAEYHRLCRDGTDCRVLWNASLIAGESATDFEGRAITRRMQTIQTLQKRLESAPDGMVTVGASGQILVDNAHLERLSEHNREELPGQQTAILVREEFPSRHPLGHTTRFATSFRVRTMGADHKLSGRRKSGRLFPLEVSLIHVRTAQGLLISCAVRDVSPRDDQQNE